MAIFDGRVEVEVGPLADFSQLVGFEDAAGQIGGHGRDLGEAVRARAGDARDEAG